MADGIYTALSGALAQQQALDVVANNVANASTKGFRADRVVFGEVLAGATTPTSATATGASSTSGSAQRGVQVEATAVDVSAGTLVRTGNPLDVAISGNGFFVVESPAGPRYTRAGAFSFDGAGALQTSMGYPVHGEGGPLTVPPGTRNIEIGEDGMLRANGQDLGKLKLVEFADPSRLSREGLTLFNVTNGVSPEDASETRVVQGHLESSNVNAMAGLNDLITVNRTFDALQRVIDTFHKLDERTARELGSRNG